MYRCTEAFLVSVIVCFVSSVYAAVEVVAGTVDWFGIAAAITALSSLVAAIFAGLAHYRIAVLQVQAKSNSDNIQKIELATNSMKDALVEATRQGAMAQGEAKGRADQKAEGSKRPEP